MDIIYKTNLAMKSHLETITQSLNDCSAKHIKASYKNNKITLVQIFNEGNRSEFIVETDFYFDMDSLLHILKKLDTIIGEGIISGCFEDEALFAKIFPLVLEHDYNAIASIIINHRGVGVGRYVGIVD